MVLFFSQYKRTDAPDHSSRGQYSFVFTTGGKTYFVDTDELVSDFIIKNKPEYTSYISAGNATLSIDGNTSEVPIMHQSIYSDDYRPTVFFDEAGKIRSKTIQLVLWDSDNNFYLFDQSNVLDYSPAYSSHIWGLMKNSDGYTKKLFQGQVSKALVGSQLIFKALAPDFENANLEATLITKFSNEKEKGYVEGNIVDKKGNRQLYGLVYSNEYGNTDKQ